MLKNTIAALLACLYVGLSVWLVRSEGQSFRESLNRTSPARSVRRGVGPRYRQGATGTAKRDRHAPSRTRA